MSFINDLAFDERVDQLEVEGTLRVGGDILLQGEFPKMHKKLAVLNASISLKANQSEMDEMEVTLSTKADQQESFASLSLKANQSDLDLALGLTEGQIDAMNVPLGTKANQVDMEKNATRISVLDTDLTERIGVLETDLESNAIRISILDTALTDNVVRIGVLETTVGSHTSSLNGLGSTGQGLYDANYAPKSWVNDKSYATESYVDGAVVTTGAVSALIDIGLAGYASSPQLSSTNQIVSDVLDTVETGYVPRPEDWNALSSPDGLKSYVEEKVMAGEGIVRHPDDWGSYPPCNFGGLPPTLRSYTEGKVNEFQEGMSSYLKLRDYSFDSNNNRYTEN